MRKTCLALDVKTSIVKNKEYLKTIKSKVM